MKEIRPRIVDYHSPDIKDVWSWKPQDLDNVCYLLEMEIAAEGDCEGEIFQVVVATPEALQEKTKDVAVLSGRGFLIIADYDWSKIESKLEEILVDCAGEKWSDVTRKLLRYFWWEYEDHEFVE